MELRLFIEALYAGATGCPGSWIMQESDVGESGPIPRQDSVKFRHFGFGICPHPRTVLAD